MLSKNNHKWHARIKNLQLVARVGIYEHEKTPQKILVNAFIEGEYPTKPTSIEDCCDYEKIYNIITESCSNKKAHTALLEQLVVDILEKIFAGYERVNLARVSIEKPDIFPNAEAVGVETEWTREDFLRICFAKQ